jgi:hypothetical protein
MGPIEVTYAGRRAALSLGEQVRLAPHIAVLEQGHPDRTFVGLLCMWAREVAHGAPPAPTATRPPTSTPAHT